MGKGFREEDGLGEQGGSVWGGLGSGGLHLIRKVVERREDLKQGA